MALTKSGALVQDWTEIASLVVETSPSIDVSAAYEIDLQLQAAVNDATLATHDGTKFIIQVSSSASGDEDWVSVTSFIDLIGTTEDGSLTTASVPTDTSLIDTKDNISTDGGYILVKDPAIANSEIAYVTSLATGVINILDGLTNAHTGDTTLTKIRNIATSRNIKIQGSNVLRARVFVDNHYDASALPIIYKLSKTITTAL